MKKNVAGQTVVAQLIAKADGTPVTTGSTEVYVLGDGGTQTASGVSPSGATHEGNGCWSYQPTAAETNFDHVAFTFVNSSAINATIQVWTSFPQTGDNYARIGAAVGSPTAQTITDDLADIKTKIDAYLDAAISSRLASASYTAPDNTTITNIYTRVGAAVGSPSAQTLSDDILDIKTKVDSNLDATVSSRLATSGYTAPDNATVTNIYARVGAAVGSPSAQTISDDLLDIKTKVDTNLDATVSSRLASASYTAPDNASITATKAVTDKLDTTLTSDMGSPGVYQFTADALDQAPTGGGTPPTAAEIADKVLGRNLAGGSDGGRTVQDGLRSLRNKSAIVAGTLTIYEEDDTTPAWTAVVTTTAGDPLSSIDPA